MIVVADTSVLLNLARIGRAGLLQELFVEVIASPEVADEFRRQAAANPRFTSLSMPAFVQLQSASSIPSWVRSAAGLHLGEVTALALAEEIHADALLMDETAGRAAAKSRGLRVIGILGILLMAKERRMISSVSVELDRLRDEAGFWVSEWLRGKVLKLADESS